MSSSLIGKEFVQANPSGKIYCTLPDNSYFIRFIPEKELAFFGLEKEGHAIFGMEGEIEDRFGTGTLEQAFEWIKDLGGTPQWMH